MANVSECMLVLALCLVNRVVLERSARPRAGYLRAFHVLDPLERLALRVDHQRPSASARDDDAVLRGEAVARQALDVPVAHARRVHHELAELELVADRDLELLELPDPRVVDERLAVAGQERAHVRQERRRDEHVADQVDEPVLQVLEQTTDTPVTRPTNGRSTVK